MRKGKKGERSIKTKDKKKEETRTRKKAEKKRDKKGKSSQQYRVKRIFKNHQGQKGSDLY